MGNGATHWTRRRSNSLNRISQSWASSTFCTFRGWRTKKLDTRASDSVASMQYAKPPMQSCSVGSAERGLLTSNEPGRCAPVSFVSEMPKYGARASSSRCHSAPSQGKRRLTSALVRLTFQPVDTLQKRSIRKTVQKTRRRSSASLQHVDGLRKAIRRISVSPAWFLP